MSRRHVWLALKAGRSVALNWALCDISEADHASVRCSSQHGTCR